MLSWFGEGEGGFAAALLGDWKPFINWEEPGLCCMCKFSLGC